MEDRKSVARFLRGTKPPKFSRTGTATEIIEGVTTCDVLCDVLCDMLCDVLYDVGLLYCVRYSMMWRRCRVLRASVIICVCDICVMVV